MSLLQEKITISENQINSVITFMALGSVIASIFIGIYLENFVVGRKGKEEEKEKEEKGCGKRIKRMMRMSLHTVIIISLCVSSLCMLIIPFCSSLWSLCVCYFIIGVSHACYENSCHVGVKFQWKKKFAVYEYLLSLSYGMGGVIFPLISAQVFKYAKQEKYQLYLLYFICGYLTVFPVIFLLFFSDDDKDDEERKGEKEIELKINEDKKSLMNEQITNDDNIDDKGKKSVINKVKGECKEMCESFFSLNTFVYLFASISIAFYYSSYTIYGELIFLYGHKKNLGTSVQLSYVVSSFFVGFTITRVVAVIFSIFISPVLMISVSMFLSLITMIMLLLFRNSLTGVWICTALYGSICSVVLPSGMVICDISFNIPLTPLRTSLLIFILYFGELVLPMVISLLSREDLFGVDVFLYVFLIMNCMALIFFIFLLFIGYATKKRNKKLLEKNNVTAVTQEADEKCADKTTGNSINEDNTYTTNISKLNLIEDDMDEKAVHLTFGLVNLEIDDDAQ